LGFRQRIGNPGGIITVTSRQQPGDAPGYVTVDPDRAFVFVHGSYREPVEGLSDLDVALWCYETVKKIQFLWFSFLEQQSLPKLVAYGDDQTQADRNAAALADAKASGVLGVPRSSDPTARAFDVVESSGKGAAQFLDAINYLEGKMSASILAGFTDLAGISAHSSTGSGGSYALSADQSEFFLAARQAVADEIAEAVSRDLIAKLCLLQFGADAKPPTLEIGPLSKRDKDRSMGMLNALLTADHFNAPPGLIDLLIKSTAGYLGLPVDQVARLVDDHPTKDPAAADAPSSGAAEAADGVAGVPVPVGEGGGSVADDPAAAFKQLAGLSNAVALTHQLVSRVNAGEDPAAVLDDLALTRHVRTEAGVKRYGLPIGSPITGGAGSRLGKPAGKTSNHKPSVVGRHALPLTSSERDIAERHFGRADQGADGQHRGAVVDPNGHLRVTDPKKAAGVLHRLAANPDNDLSADRRAQYHTLRDRIAATTTTADAKPKPPRPVLAPNRAGWEHATPATTYAARQRAQSALLEDWRSRMPQTSLAERRAVSHYTGTGFIGMNGHLRAGGSTSPEDRAQVAALSALAGRYTTPATFTAYRFAHNDGLPEGVSTGDVVTEPGFTSAAIETDDMRAEFRNRAVRMQITVPAGMHAVNVNGVGASGISSENELILPPNTRFVITGDEQKGGQRWVSMTAMPPP
jgi:hypothetical protein